MAYYLPDVDVGVAHKSLGQFYVSILKVFPRFEINFKRTDTPFFCQANC